MSDGSRGSHASRVFAELAQLASQRIGVEAPQWGFSIGGVRGWPRDLAIERVLLNPMEAAAGKQEFCFVHQQQLHVTRWARFQRRVDCWSSAGSN